MCPIQFKSKSALNKHIKIHSKDIFKYAKVIVKESKINCRTEPQLVA